MFKLASFIAGLVLTVTLYAGVGQVARADCTGRDCPITTPTPCSGRSCNSTVTIDCLGTGRPCPATPTPTPGPRS